ncbi:hypothetical protein TWF718_005938 [Orbilia javanica]|uniref:Uncharacterized protein n=1 Tax=Orbilia javanica TaxID=47235 RepID=A0AAN8MSL9_9PEZI
MSFCELVNSFGAPALEDTLRDLSIPDTFAESDSSSTHDSFALPSDYTFQHLDISATLTAIPYSHNVQGNIPWSIQHYIDSSVVPWTDKVLLVSSAQGESLGLRTLTPTVRFQEFPNKESLSLSISSEGTSVMSYHRGSATAIGYGLPASADMHYSMVSGARQASGDSRSYHQRPSEASYTYPRGGGGPSKSSRHSKSRSGYDQDDDGEDDESSEHPNYIPSSNTRTKARASGSSDFACWFFKLDPVKYADCIHIHGRSSDLKYAHLKNHFKDGNIPPGFDKNMSWDEVWATLFPGTRPPNNKYYVINDMIMSMLESASPEGDDVTRFLDTLTNQENREMVLNRLYSLSGDRGNSPSSASAGTSRRSRRELQLPSFDRTPRTVDNGLTVSPHSSSGGSGNTTPAIASRSSHRYPANYDSYPNTHGGLGLGMDSTIDPGAYPYSDTVGALTSPVGQILIWDDSFNTVYVGPPWQCPIDFNTFYLSHACSKSRSGEVRILSLESLQEEYTWHEDGSCPFNLVARRG